MRWRNLGVNTKNLPILGRFLVLISIEILD